MLRNLPKISVVIPSYNAEKYIRQTLESIFKQNYSNLEVIIQDGGSRDETVAIIKKFAQKYPKKIKWVSQKDKGQLDAIKKGLKKATGEILTYINADDIYQKEALLKVGEYFAEHTDTLWLAGKGDIINEQGKSRNSGVTSYKNLLLKINCYWFLLIVNYLVQPSVFLSKKAYQKFGPFQGEGRIIMEYGLWLKLGKVKMPVVLDEHLSSFRLTSSNFSSTQYKKLLKADFGIAQEHTHNPIVLWLHKLHNWARVLMVS